MSDDLAKVSLADSPNARWWNTLTPETVYHAILVGSKPENFPAFDIGWMFKDFVRPTKVLDFGCGIGRNVSELRKYYGEHVIGYDLPGMIDRMTDEVKRKYWVITSDWNTVCNLQPEIILASLVFQHIDAKILNQYLADMQKWTHTLLYSGRGTSDTQGIGIHTILATYYKISEERFHDMEMGVRSWYEHHYSITLHHDAKPTEPTV